MNQQQTCPEEWNELASDKHDQRLEKTLAMTSA
jgi:hypothetical protein